MAYAAPPQAPPARLRADILDAAAREPRTAPAPVLTRTRPRRAMWRGWSGWPAWAPRVAIGAGALAAIACAVLVLTSAAPSVRSVALHGVPGSVVVTNQAAALESQDFAPLSAGRVYEMWVIHDGAARPAGLFRSAARPVAVAGTVTSGDTVAVTQEPAGGSAQPTTTPVATAAI
jgi:anti-sigma-K factor RskA